MFYTKRSQLFKNSCDDTPTSAWYDADSVDDCLDGYESTVSDLTDKNESLTAELAEKSSELDSTKDMLDAYRSLYVFTDKECEVRYLDSDDTTTMRIRIDPMCHMRPDGVYPPDDDAVGYYVVNEEEYDALKNELTTTADFVVVEELN